jgi:hypothetical protein
MNTRNTRAKLSREQIKELWGTAAIYIDWEDGSNSLLQENGYTLNDALAFEAEKYRIFTDGIPLSSFHKFKVKTPVGYLMIEQKGTENEYPGVYISFSNEGKEADIGNVVACVEYDNNSKKLMTTTYQKEVDEPSNITLW